jgi:hypothetical protein
MTPDVKVIEVREWELESFFPFESGSGDGFSKNTSPTGQRVKIKKLFTGMAQCLSKAGARQEHAVCILLIHSKLRFPYDLTCRH